MNADMPYTTIPRIQKVSRVTRRFERSNLVRSNSCLARPEEQTLGWSVPQISDEVHWEKSCPRPSDHELADVFSPSPKRKIVL